MAFFKKFALSLLLCLGGGWLSGYVTRQGIDDWYRHLVHPPGTPPDFIFPLVWTLLYLLMAIALALVWSNPSSKKTSALFFFCLQLLFNFSWSWLFFVERSPVLALADLILLWVFLLATIIAFKRVSSLAAYLLLPYLLWVTYAMYLNLFIWIQN